MRSLQSRTDNIQVKFDLMHHSNMPFLCFRNPLPDFFTAVIKDDVDFVKFNAERFAGKYDERETDGGEGIVNGVAAIHYAALFGK